MRKGQVRTSILTAAWQEAPCDISANAVRWMDLYTLNLRVDHIGDV